MDAAATQARQPAGDLIEAFGTFIAPGLLRMYAVLIKPTWSSLDVIENTEAVIHAVVRVNQAGAKPPELRCTRLADDELELRYDSPPKLCRLARGIMLGIAAKYGDRLEIAELQCMNLGAPACTLRVRRTILDTPSSV